MFPWVVASTVPAMVLVPAWYALDAGALLAGARRRARLLQLQAANEKAGDPGWQQLTRKKFCMIYREHWLSRAALFGCVRPPSSRAVPAATHVRATAAALVHCSGKNIGKGTK